MNNNNTETIKYKMVRMKIRDPYDGPLMKRIRGYLADGKGLTSSQISALEKPSRWVLSNVNASLRKGMDRGIIVRKLPDPKAPMSFINKYHYYLNTKNDG
jgi:hypothetical protein